MSAVVPELFIMYRPKCMYKYTFVLAAASRSRQSENQLIIVELALIEHAHMGRSFQLSVQAEQRRCVIDQVITIEQAYAVTTIQA